MGTLHENRYTFSIISRSIHLRMRNILDKCCRENQNTRFVFNNFFPQKPCRLWNNVEEYFRAGEATGGNTRRLTRIACLITRATDTHSEYIIPIAFSRQQWLIERAQMFRYTLLFLFSPGKERLILLRIMIWKKYECISIQWRNWRKWRRTSGFCSLDVRNFNHSWFCILIPLFRPFVTFRRIVTSRLPPLSCYCVYQSQLSEAHSSLTFWRRNYFFNFSTPCI